MLSHRPEPRDAECARAERPPRCRGEKHKGIEAGFQYPITPQVPFCFNAQLSIKEPNSCWGPRVGWDTHITFEVQVSWLSRNIYT